MRVPTTWMKNPTAVIVFGAHVGGMILTIYSAIGDQIYL
jgi:hypothetical protein